MMPRLHCLERFWLLEVGGPQMDFQRFYWLMEGIWNLKPHNQTAAGSIFTDASIKWTSRLYVDRVS